MADVANDGIEGGFEIKLRARFAYELRNIDMEGSLFNDGELLGVPMISDHPSLKQRMSTLRFWKAGSSSVRGSESCLRFTMLCIQSFDIGVVSGTGREEEWSKGGVWPRI